MFDYYIYDLMVEGKITQTTGWILIYIWNILGFWVFVNII